MKLIDLNADLGEGPGEEILYPLVSSANIACGGHTGDEGSMREAVRRAIAHGVAVGAHPGYPDRERFGRESMRISASELAASIAAQIRSLARVAEELGAAVTHVKPHGALYHDAARDPAVAQAVADGVRAVSTDLVLFGFPGSISLALWSDLRLSIAAEGFADRAYGDDGRLVPRSQAGALIDDPERAAEQAAALARHGIATVCVHSDTPGAATILRAVRERLERDGWRIASLAEGKAGH
jgi:UPF0271 protein